MRLVSGAGILAMALGAVVPAAAGELDRVYLKKEATGWVEVRRGADGTLTRAPASAPVVAALPPTSGEGRAVLRPYQALPVGSWEEAVAIGDVNGDGRNDVVLTTTFFFDPENDHHLHVFLQDEGGRLVRTAKHPTGLDPMSVAVGDVNGDGRADVVIGNTGSDSIGVFLQNESGTLDPMVAYPTSQSLRVVIGDVNGDGLQDIVGIDWGSNGDEVDVLLQNRGGTLDPPVTYHVSHGGYDDLSLGDVNADGRLDIVVMSGQGYEYANVGILLQRPDGTFGSAVYYDLGGNELTSGVGVGDVTGDGREDVVVSHGGNRPSSFITVFRQTPTGALEADPSLLSYDSPEPVEVADIDGDGRKDVIVVHGGWVRLGVYLQGPDGRLSSEGLYRIPYATHYNPHGLAVGDINGDGRNDVAIADYNNGLVVLYGKVDYPERDFEGDGKTDVMLYHEASGFWFGLASSTGRLGALRFGGPGFRPMPADYDADGKADLAVFHEASQTWYALQSRTRTVATIPLIAPDYEPVHADFDGDGRGDATGYIAKEGLWVFRRSMTGTQEITPFGGLDSVPVPGDFDGDGQTDAALYFEQRGQWFIRLSSTWAGQLVSLGGPGHLPVRGDFDGDGMTDPATHDPSTAQWMVLPSTTGTPVSFSYGAPGSMVVPGDYDGDRKTDLALYDPATGRWQLRFSRTGAAVTFVFGGPGFEAVR